MGKPPEPANHRPVVIVTGANNGIGFYLTVALLRDGYRVAGLDLAGDNLVTLQDRYEGLAFERCDMTRDDEVQAAVHAVVRRWGRIDVLVNNACEARFRPFVEKDIDELRREMEVNYFGYCRMIHAVLPVMRAQGGGIIHNLSSGIGMSGFAHLSGYAASKGAIEALARTLALELEGSGIAVTLVHPPLTDTRSAAPLRVPKQAKADPAVVGSKLARKIMSTRPVITPDWQTACYVLIARRFPRLLGKLFSSAADVQPW